MTFVDLFSSKDQVIISYNEKKTLLLNIDIVYRINTLRYSFRRQQLFSMIDSFNIHSICFVTYPKALVILSKYNPISLMNRSVGLF